jgi:dissimilatory sulfite reductase (desulfoviridin) alpha/beta subunit
VRAIFYLLLVLAVAYWVWGLRRAGTLFVVSVREGRVARTNGRIPARLLSEIADIIERGGVTRANIRATVRDGAPVLHFEGDMSPGIQQQVRNVVGQFSAAQIRNSKSSDER